MRHSDLYFGESFTYFMRLQLVLDMSMLCER